MPSQYGFGLKDLFYICDIEITKDFPFRYLFLFIH